MQKITVVIDNNGDPTISVNGIKGRSCKDVTKALEKALGAVSKSTETQEAYEQQPLVARNRG